MKKNIISWVNSKLYVKNTKTHGRGVYTKEKIKKNDKLAIFGGHVMTRTEEEKTSSGVYDNAIQIDENFVIGATRPSELKGDRTNFNHSCEPNAGIKGQILLVAMRDIEIGEQITFDYATVLHKAQNVKHYSMKCSCGSKMCRGIVTDEDWKKPELQNKYRGFFSYYLEEKINKIKNK